MKIAWAIGRTIDELRSCSAQVKLYKNHGIAHFVSAVTLTAE
jgi:hypothetical protein